MNDRWLLRLQQNPDPELRLFCLPYAGGSASVYRQWHRLVPSGIEICAVELPGRGRRMGEPAFQFLAPLVRALAGAIEPVLDRPFALFGHSMGGLIAFELARWLQELGGPQPRRLFVSATSAPGPRLADPPVHHASDAEVRNRLRSLNGTPRELLEDDELMDLMIPIVRTDFSVVETHEHGAGLPLDVPITVFGGLDDRTVRPAALAGWRAQSTAGSRLRLFPGDHFFLHAAAADIVSTIMEDLDLGVPVAGSLAEVAIG